MDVGAQWAHLVLQPSNEPRQPADLGVQAVLLGVRGAWERGTEMLTGQGQAGVGAPPPPDRGLPVPVGSPGPIGTTLRSPPRTPQPVPVTTGHHSLTRWEALSLLRSHELVVGGVGGRGTPGPGLHRAMAGPAVVLSAEGVGERTL